MTAHGHIPDEWLVSYAAGALSDAQALLVATHVDYHPGLKARVAEAEAIGGALLEGVAPKPMKTDAFDDLMARIDMLPDDEEAPAPPSAAERGLDTDIPPVLADYLGRRLDDMNWRLMGPGMRQCRLAKGKDGECLWLLRARGGTVMPMHDHRGTEFTLVLRGSYHVGDQQFTPGLLEIAASDLKDHQPMIDEGEDCICLVITEAPIRIHSLLGRMVQPFIGL
ncbi:MAG: transcriptional regulator [Alphaproteobacteria bacterium]|nr:MAG: transcriptional regulator [Alphaproteobacteria bacterium]